MFTQYDQQSHRHNWIINTWYEKLYFVVGMIWVWLFTAAFMFGFIKALFE